MSIQLITLAASKKGQDPVTFHKGGLHRSLGVPEGEDIPADKMRKALAGDYGPLAAKQARMAEGMLKQGRATAAAHRGGR